MEHQPSAHKKLRAESERPDVNSSSQRSVFIEHPAPTESSSSFTQTSRLHIQHSVDLPHNLSNWDRKHLEQLDFNISFLSDLTPVQLINKNQNDLTLLAEEEHLKIKLDLIERSRFTTFLDSLNYSNFNDLTINKPMLWEMFLDDRCSFVPKCVPKDLELWFYSFHAFAKQFAHRLYKILQMKEVNGSIEECDYQFLFDSFVSAFGMLSGTSFTPCLRNQTFTVGDIEVAGVPSIVFCCNSLPTESRMTGDRVVAVCEVQKESPQSEKKSCSPLSSKSTDSTNKKRPHVSEVETSSHGPASSTTKTDSSMQMCNWKVSDKLIGQHGGKLLLNFSNSFRRNTVLGMIVQQTQVSFTSLEMTHKMFEGIVNGDWMHRQEDRPVLTVTRPYDILKKEDRKQLIETFIKFADFQRQ